MKRGSKPRAAVGAQVGGPGPAAVPIHGRTCSVVALQRVFYREVIVGYPPEIATVAEADSPLGRQLDRARHISPRKEGISDNKEAGTFLTHLL